MCYHTKGQYNRRIDAIFLILSLVTEVMCYSLIFVHLCGSGMYLKSWTSLMIFSTVICREQVFLTPAETLHPPQIYRAAWQGRMVYRRAVTALLLQNAECVRFAPGEHVWNVYVWGAYLLEPPHCLKAKSTARPHPPRFSQGSSAPRGW